MDHAVDSKLSERLRNLVSYILFIFQLLILILILDRAVEPQKELDYLPGRGVMLRTIVYIVLIILFCRCSFDAYRT